MIVTKKIKLLVCGNYDEKVNSWKLLRYYENIMPKLNNFIVTELLLNDLLQEKFISHNEVFNKKLNQLKIDIDEKILERNCFKRNVEDISIDKIEKIEMEIENLKFIRNSLITEEKKKARDLFKQAFNKTLDGTLNERIRGQDDFKNLPDTIISPAINELKYYKKNIYKIKLGEERIKFYSKGIPFNTRSRDLKFYELNNDIYINWVKKIKFQLVLGRDRSHNKVSINDIILGKSKPLDSKIQIKNNEIFLLLSLKVEEKLNDLDINNILGVCLGKDIPIYMSSNINLKINKLGDINDFLRLKLILEKQKKSILNSLLIIKGGKGKKRKLESLERLKEKEKRFTKNYNHFLSSEIIKNAIKLRCKQINLEFFKNYEHNIKELFFLKNWNYSQLYELLEYKCKMNGINLKYIDSLNLNNICSSCGFLNEENHNILSFICKNCAYEENLDINKVMNITKSKTYENN